MNRNVNTLTVTNVSWTPEIDHNLLSKVPLANKGMKVLLKKKIGLLKIYFEREIFDFIGIVGSQCIKKQASFPMQTKKNISLKPGGGKVDIHFIPKDNSDNNIFSGLTSASDNIDLLFPRSSRSLHLSNMEVTLGPLAKAVKILFASCLNGSENFVNKRVNLVQSGMTRVHIRQNLRRKIQHGKHGLNSIRLKGENQIIL